MPAGGSYSSSYGHRALRAVGFIWLECFWKCDDFNLAGEVGFGRENKTGIVGRMVQYGGEKLGVCLENGWSVVILGLVVGDKAGKVKQGPVVRSGGFKYSAK